MWNVCGAHREHVVPRGGDTNSRPGIGRRRPGGHLARKAAWSPVPSVCEDHRTDPFSSVMTRLPSVRMVIVTRPDATLRRAAEGAPGAGRGPEARSRPGGAAHGRRDTGAGRGDHCGAGGDRLRTVGARPYVERVAVELRACGMGVRGDAVPRGASSGSPRSSCRSRGLAATGPTNRQIANRAQLRDALSGMELPGRCPQCTGSGPEDIRYGGPVPGTPRART